MLQKEKRTNMVAHFEESTFATFLWLTKQLKVQISGFKKRKKTPASSFFLTDRNILIALVPYSQKSLKFNNNSCCYNLSYTMCMIVCTYTGKKKRKRLESSSLLYSSNADGHTR